MAPCIRPTSARTTAPAGPHEIAAVDGLTGAEIRHYEWTLDYSAAEYAGMLATTSDVRLLEAGRREPSWRRSPRSSRPTASR